MNITQGGKIGLTLCGASYLVGGNWGYLKESHKDYGVLSGLMQLEKNILRVTAVQNGALVLCNEKILADTVRQIAPEMLTNEIIENHHSRSTNEKRKSLKFLESIVQKTTKYGVQYDNFTEYHIGIYSNNETSKIRVNGIDYPAFKLTLKEKLENLNMMQKFCKVYIKVVNDGIETFINIAELEQDYESVMRGLEISDTLTGVFLTIRIPYK